MLPYIHISEVPIGVYIIYASKTCETKVKATLVVWHIFSQSKDDHALNDDDREHLAFLMDDKHKVFSICLRQFSYFLSTLVQAFFYRTWHSD